MIQLTAYRERQFYRSKYGEKLYIDSEDGDTAFKCAIISGKMLETEEVEVYTSAGETKQEAEKALANYLSANNILDTISRVFYH